MKCHQTEQSNKGCSAGGIYISQRAFTAFLFWVCEILQDFAVPKQALINAFYNMSAKPIARIALQRYYKICGCARKIALKCDFSGVGCKAGDLLARIVASTKPVVGIKHVYE